MCVLRIYIFQQRKSKQLKNNTNYYLQDIEYRYTMTVFYRGNIKKNTWKFLTYADLYIKSKIKNHYYFF